MRTKKYPKVHEAICKAVDWEIENALLIASRREPIINLEYSRHCSAISKGIETEAEAIEHFTVEEVN